MHAQNETLKEEIDKCIVKKTFTCLVCKNKFENYVVRPVKVRTISTDIDLRPICIPVDPTYYNVLICNHCGYATPLVLIENRIRPEKAKLIKEKITPYFKPREYPKVLSAEQVIERYKLALVCAIEKKGANSEKGYICLKLAWVYRSIHDKKNELKYLNYAVVELEEAYLNERFPICNIKEHTFVYLVGAIHTLLRDFKQALKWVGKVLLEKNVSRGLKIKAFDLKVHIRDEIKKLGENV